MAAVDKTEQALVDRWRDILTLHARTQCELDRTLHAHGLCGSDFEASSRVVRGAGEASCSYRVQEISERVHLSQSALSRLIARLEKDGLLERALCPEDRGGRARGTHRQGAHAARRGASGAACRC